MSEKDLTSEEIETIRAAAARLPLIEPPRDLWPGIEARLGSQIADIGREARRRPAAIVISRRMLASAAAVLMMATAGATYLIARDRLPEAGGLVAGLDPVADGRIGMVNPASLTVGGDFGAYAGEIEVLQGAIAERRARLDPETVAVIERNLKIIDAAIEESRRALANDPASPLLASLLSEALANKVRLLRQAALLPPLT